MMYLTILQICKHTQEEYIAKRSVNQLKAYEMSQKQLFSDEHETLDSRLLHIFTLFKCGVILPVGLRIVVQAAIWLAS